MDDNDDFDLESLVHVEQTFYDAGYRDGFVHGRIHGFIEARALGREKGFEMWEELGFYQGFALMWEALYKQVHPSRLDDRTTNHIKHLTNLISQFPRVNPSTSHASSSSVSEPDLDIPKLFRQIRSRYKALCATLGVRPSLRASEAGDSAVDRDDMLGEEAAANMHRKGINTIWQVNQGQPEIDIDRGEPGRKQRILQPLSF